MLQPLRATLLLLLSAVAWFAPLQANAQTKGRDFDFYVLSLSWSPTFCASKAGAGNRDQCATSRRHGLIVHGLWPQHERGYPAFCRTGQPQRVPPGLARSYFDIMPSVGLIGHQWRKHGSCSGLSQQEYFSTTRAAFERIRIPFVLKGAAQETRLSPVELERQIIRANPSLEPQAIAVTCEAGKLDEVRICLTKDLRFRTCPEVDRSGCRQALITVPPVY